MCYIDNVVNANILVANHSKKFKGECYNIAHGARTSNNEILQALKQRFGEKVRIKHAPERPGDVKHTQANWQKAHKDFGYEPKVKFWEGLEKTYQWWNI